MKIVHCNLTFLFLNFIPFFSFSDLKFKSFEPLFGMFIDFIKFLKLWLREGCSLQEVFTLEFSGVTYFPRPRIEIHDEYGVSLMIKWRPDDWIKLWICANTSFVSAGFPQDSICSDFGPQTDFLQQIGLIKVQFCTQKSWFQVNKNRYLLNSYTAVHVQPKRL